MSKRPFDFDPTTGMTIEYEDTEDGFNLHYSQDAEPVLDLNKAQENSGEKQADDNFWLAARIPTIVQLKWLTEHGVDIYDPDHAPAVKRLLNDPEYMYLRPFRFRI